MSLTTLESDKVNIGKSAEKMYNYLTDFRHFEKLMPSQVADWSATENECSFTISGMATIGMKIIEKIPHSKIVVTSNGKVPFDFKMIVNFTDSGADSCVGQVNFEAELNPMMKMMVEKPLGNFFNMLANKMADLNV